MSVIYTDKSKELNFQNDIIKQMQSSGWLLGKPENYNRKLAIYEEDLIGFVKDTQTDAWDKYCKIYPNNTEQKLLERVASQLNKADPNAADKTMRTFGTYVRFYEFMSQIVDYNDHDLEKHSLSERNLRPMLRETVEEEDDVDLSNVVLSHYCLSKIRQQNLQLQEDPDGYGLNPGQELGTAKPKDKQEELLSQIISRLNEL